MIRRQIIRWFERHGWHYHDQDLREPGGTWFDWRGWLGRYNVERTDYHDVFDYQVCVLPRWKHWSLEVEVSQRSIKPHISTPIFALYIGFKGALERLPMWKFLPGEWRPSYEYDPVSMRHTASGPTRKYVESAVTGLSFDDGSLRWQIWHPTMSWSSKTPRWRYGYINLPDLLFGKPQYVSDKQSPVAVSIPMLEGQYPATVTMHQDSWTRPRWPFPKTIRRATVDVESPPQFSGKGENSWDCGDDGISSLTCVARTPDEAVGEYVKSVLRNRERYGNPSGLARGEERYDE